MSTTASSKAGSLIIAGSGIASVAHITLETVSCMKEADKVFYVVCDPATEAFIHSNAKAAPVNLTTYYDARKPRYDSYVQMAEVMLQDVRAGRDVFGIFYGHPGVFVSPSHRALTIARAEGYKAKMLPGVSAEDYLFADLGFDPAVQGCATFEATELLLRGIPLDRTVNNIIWQVGCIGVGDMVFDNARFHLLVERLEQDFGPEHKVVHYIGAVLPQSATVMDTFTIAQLRDEEVVKQINPSSTLYVPPREPPTHSDAMAARLGVENLVSLHRRQVSPPPRWASDALETVPAYGDHEKAAVAQLADHTAPEDHKVLVASPALRKVTSELGVSPALQARYKADPKAFADATEGLTRLESVALGSGQAGPLYYVMRAAPGKEVTEADLFVQGQDPTAFAVIVVVVAAAVIVL